MKTAMISQAMNGKTKDEILRVRERAIEDLESRGYRVINTFFENDYDNSESLRSLGIVNVPVHFLAKSLESMSTCHAVYFCKGWDEARGCKIENAVAKAYGVELIYED